MFTSNTNLLQWKKYFAAEAHSFIEDVTFWPTKKWMSYSSPDYMQINKHEVPMGG